MAARTFTTMFLVALLALTAAPSSAFAGRKLLAGTYESSGDWGSSTTTVDADGSSTTTTDTPYYKGTTESQGRKLSSTYESSGDWGSTTTTVNADGSTSTTTDTPYYKGTYDSQGRKLSATYESSGDWGSTTTTTNADGSSTTTVDTPYYKGTTDTPATTPSAYDTPENRAAAEAIAENVLQGRKLSATYGSSGNWGSTETTTNADGSSTTTVDTPYYKGTTGTPATTPSSYDTPENRAAAEAIAANVLKGRKLSATYGSSGSWGSTETTVNPDGSSTTKTETPYYSGSTDTPATTPSSYDTPENRAAAEAIVENVLQGRKLSATYGSSGSWGSTKTTVNPDGSSTTTTDTPYYKGSTSSPATPPSQYDTPENRAAAQQIASSVLSG